MYVLIVLVFFLLIGGLVGGHYQNLCAKVRIFFHIYNT